jgi:hypothetical protein
MDVIIGARQLSMNKLVGIRQFQLEECMNESNWNETVPTRSMDDWIKLKLDSSNNVLAYKGAWGRRHDLLSFLWSGGLSS